MSLKLSIVVTSYNTEKYVDSCMKCLFQQTGDLSLYEVIIVDDGSTDETLQKCQNYASKYSNIRVISQPHTGGPSMGRNRGIEEAKGDYIFFLDMDDILGLETVERLVKFIDEWHSDCILVKLANTKKANLPLYKFGPNQENLNPYQSSICHTLLGPCACYRVAFLREHHIQFPSDMTYEDNIFNFQVFFLAHKISMANDYDYYYYLEREDGSSLTDANSRNALDFMKIEKRLKAFATMNHLFDQILDKKQNWHEIKEKLMWMSYNTFTYIMNHQGTQADLKKLLSLTERYYDFQLLDRLELKRYVVLYALTQNQDFDFMEKIYHLARDQKYNIEKEDNHFILHFSSPNFKMDVTNYFQSYMEAYLTKVTYEEKKWTMTVLLASCESLKNADINGYFMRKDEKWKDLLKKKSFQVSSSKWTSSIYHFPLPYTYEVTWTVPIDKIMNFLKEEKGDSSSFYMTIFNSTTSCFTILPKEMKESYYAFAYHSCGSILIPDVDGKQYLVFRGMNATTNLKECSFLQGKVRPLPNQILWLGLLQNQYSLVCSMIQDIEKKQLRAKLSWLNHYYYYYHDGKKIKFKNPNFKHDLYHRLKRIPSKS